MKVPPKRWVWVLITTLFVSFAAAEAPTDVTFPRFIEIGTASVGGVYYPPGIAMAEILTSNFKTQATAQVTGGALENIQLIQDGNVKLAITTTANAFRGRNGLAPFTQEHPRVMALMSGLSQGVYHIAARPGSGIKTLTDLVGKRVSLGPAGGLGVELSSYVFEAAGFAIKDVRATYLSYDESASMMADGNLDAVIFQTALPNPALTQLEATGHSFEIVPLPEDVISQVVADHPYFSRFEVPADMYDMPANAPTLNGTNMVIVDSELSEDVVYLITKAFIDNIDSIRASHPAIGAFNADSASVVPIPLHPGAVRYYRDAGLLSE